MREYFAKDDVSKLIDKCEEKINTWGALGGSSGFMTSAIRAIHRNNAAYYAAMLDPQAWDTSMIYEGEKGELVKTIIPKARVLIRQYISLATKQRYSFDCVIDVGDSNPLKTARIGNTLIKNEVEKHKLDLLSERIVEMCAIEGWCFVANTWNTEKGKIYGRADELGNMIYTGGTELEQFSLQDCVFDWTKKDPKDLEWICIRRKRNRWNLIAQFPEMRDEILAIPACETERLSMPTLAQEQAERNDDDVYVREFYHVPTPALPFGRMTIYGNKDTVFYDGENIYECIPGVFFIFQQVKNTLLGYPMMCNMLQQQEMFNMEMGTVTTNHAAFGVQSVLVPKGSNISVESVAKGMTFIDYTPQNAQGGGKPEALQLTATPAEVFNFVQMLSAGLEEMAMINSTLRGQPPANVTSGAMAATLSANALEFIYSDTKGLTIGLEHLMWQSVKNYQKFAKAEQVIDVVGEGNTSLVESFKAENLNSVKKIKVKQGNPILNTVAGRLQLAESVLPLLQQGKNDAVNRYLGIIDGAPIDSLFDSELSENVAVMQEIEALQRGENVIPILTDNHPMYIRAYQKLLYSPIVRRRGDLVQSLMQLIQERTTLEQQCSPDLKAMLRNLPMPMMQPPVAETTEAPSQAAAQPMNETAEPAQPAQPEV